MKIEEPMSKLIKSLFLINIYEDENCICSLVMDGRTVIQDNILESNDQGYRLHFLLRQFHLLYLYSTQKIDHLYVRNFRGCEDNFLLDFASIFSNTHKSKSIYMKNW
jgi:hypothetical protein